jgi:hypothetical protein
MTIILSRKTMFLGHSLRLYDAVNYQCCLTDFKSNLSMLTANSSHEDTSLIISDRFTNGLLLQVQIWSLLKDHSLIHCTAWSNKQRSVSHSQGPEIKSRPGDRFPSLIISVISSVPYRNNALNRIKLASSHTLSSSLSTINRSLCYIAWVTYSVVK